MRKIYALIIAVCSLISYAAHAEPRSYPEDVFDDLNLLFDIMVASDLDLDISDPEILSWAFPERSFEDFDRNRSGTFTVNPNGEDPAEWAIADLATALIQFRHDTVDYDGDGLTGFVELECEFALRAPDHSAISLNPEEASTDGLIADSELDCDGDGVTNGVEARYGLNPLDGFDLDRDLDGDGISNQDELRIGTHPGLVDTDGDGLTDLSEIGADLENPIDSNQDGIIDALEPGTGRVTISRQSLIIAGTRHSSTNYRVKSSLVLGGHRASSAQYQIRGELTP